DSHTGRGWAADCHPTRVAAPHPPQLSGAGAAPHCRTPFSGGTLGQEATASLSLGERVPGPTLCLRRHSPAFLAWLGLAGTSWCALPLCPHRVWRLLLPLPSRPAPLPQPPTAAGMR